MALFRRRAPGTLDEPVTGAPVPAEPPGEDLPPSRLRGTEPLYGYVVALELLVVAILNLVITTGKGAPAHPQTALQLVGVIAPLGFAALLRLRNRTLAGFAAIVAAFFVTLPRVPNSLSVAHVFALAIPLAYGLIITQRQRKAMGSAVRGGRRAGGGRRPREDTKAAGPPAARRRRGRADSAPASGPRPSPRYTPPKAKRGKARR